MLFKVITTIAIAVPVFVLAAPRGGSDGIAIPLTRRSDIETREFHTTSHNTKIIRGPSGMYGSETNTGMPHNHASAVKRDGSGAGVALTSYHDVWYGTISIGTPPKSFTVQFNTASSDLFVPAVTGDENCRSHPNLWDPTASSQITNLDLNTYPPSNVDLNTNFATVFDDDRVVRGKQHTDTVTIAGLIADIQTIGAATTYSSSMGVSEFAPDGILGVAFPSYSNFVGKSPLFHTLYNEGKLSQPMFSLKLTKSGGELYVGGTNEALYVRNALVFTPVTRPVYWELKIDNIKINGATVLTDVAAIDTGAHFIIGDPRRVLALHKAAGGGPFINWGTFPEGQISDGYYIFPCNSVPSVTFTIGGKPFSIPASALNQGRVVRNSRNCFSGVASVKNAEYWSIGTIFLQQYYTVFDFNSESPRVGFAELMSI